MSVFQLKVLLTGAKAVDGTKLINKYTSRSGAKHKLTVGAEIFWKDVEFRKGEIAILSIWDIGEQQRFEFIRSTFYKGAAGAILVFDLTREETYIEIKKRLTEIRSFASEYIPFILVGDNVHLLKLTDGTKIRKEAREFAESEGGIYIETSPTSIDIIEGALQKLTLKIIDARWGKTGEYVEDLIMKNRKEHEKLKEEDRKHTGITLGEEKRKIFLIEVLKKLSNGPIPLENLREWFIEEFPDKDFEETINSLVEQQFISKDQFGLVKIPNNQEITQEEKDFLKNLRDGDYDFFPYPYLFSPPSPPGEGAAEAVPRPEYISPKKLSETILYCKHCGATLTKGQSVCHVCKNKVI
ncbi:MAG: Rab family GTPase [Promethearchaeota archaeon]